MVNGDKVNVIFFDLKKIKLFASSDKSLYGEGKHFELLVKLSFLNANFNKQNNFICVYKS